MGIFKQLIKMVPKQLIDERKGKIGESKVNSKLLTSEFLYIS